MKLTSELGVGAKLRGAFLIVLLLTGIIGLIGLYQLSRVNEMARSLGEDWMPSVSSAQVIRYQFIRHRMKEYRLFLATDADRRQNEKSLLDVRDDVQKSIDNEEKLSDTAEEVATIKRIQENWKAYVRLSDKAVEVNRAGDQAAAMTVLKNAQGSYDAVINAIEDMVKVETAGGDAANQLSGEIYRHSRWVIVSLTVLAIVLGAWLSLLITRAIVQRLAASVRLAEAVAEGDLTGRLAVEGGDEVAKLQAALSRMVAQLRQVVGDVRDGVESVSSASAQISIGNQDLSARTEQTASNLEQTASSMEELTGNVAQSADTARQANQLASQAAQAAGRGGEVVGLMIQRMDRISDASRRIADIIGAIDGIAFQTNILALNAAVEAARAGEHGKGFAVVASEVRALAQRSAEAAKEVKTLIARSVEAVDAGTVDVAQAGRTMEEIMSSVRRVTDLMGEIATASAEQRDGIHQVNQAVAQLDQMTQRNAALVEESSAASTSVSEQAQRLSKVVSVFRLG